MVFSQSARFNYFSFQNFHNNIKFFHTYSWYFFQLFAYTFFMLLHKLFYRFTSHFLYSTVLMWSQALISQTSFHNKQMFIPLFYLYSAFVHIFILFFFTVHICTYQLLFIFSFFFSLLFTYAHIHSFLSYWTSFHNKQMFIPLFLYSTFVHIPIHFHMTVRTSTHAFIHFTHFFLISISLSGFHINFSLSVHRLSFNGKLFVACSQSSSSSTLSYRSHSYFHIKSGTRFAFLFAIYLQVLRVKDAHCSTTPWFTQN